MYCRFKSIHHPKNAGKFQDKSACVDLLEAASPPYKNGSGREENFKQNHERGICLCLEFGI